MTAPTQPTDRVELIAWAQHRYELAQDHEDAAWQTDGRGPQFYRLAGIRACWRETVRILDGYPLDVALPLLQARREIAERNRRRMDGDPDKWAATLVVEAGDELEIFNKVVATVEETTRLLGGSS